VALYVSVQGWVFNRYAYRDKKVVGVFVRFVAPLHLSKRRDPIYAFARSFC
jgi:hypothetical protein